jgi:glucose/arabinose dehydrogenase
MLAVVRRMSLVLVAALVLASCGDDPTAAPPSPTAPASPVSPSPAPAQPAGPDPEAFRGRLIEVASLQQPLAMAVRINDPALYFAQKTGEVVAVDDGGAVRTVLDLSRRVSQGGEQGLLGIAFSPNGQYLYANWTDIAGDTHVTEYPIRSGGTAGRDVGRDVLVVDQPYTNHNGGQLAFGPDGFLYIGLGDGGSAGDPQDNAQNLGSLLGKILRIQPRASGGQPYSIPSGNPFVDDPSARPEVWAYGLRNPWRFSFDRLNGDVWIGDVGQSAVEEVDRQPGSSDGGENYGWDGYEGTTEFEAPLPEGAVDPVYEYGRNLGASVIGGVVYRGSEIPELQGAYIFGDYYHPTLRALVLTGSQARHVELPLNVPNLSAIGEDASGELYAMSLTGAVYRLSP